VRIVFKTEEGVPYEEKLNLLVGVHRVNELTEKEKELVTKLPSLLGRDIIRKFKFIFEEKESLVLFEK